MLKLKERALDEVVVGETTDGSVVQIRKDANGHSVSVLNRDIFERALRQADEVFRRSAGGLDAVEPGPTKR